MRRDRIHVRFRRFLLLGGLFLCLLFRHPCIVALGPNQSIVRYCVTFSNGPTTRSRKLLQTSVKSARLFLSMPPAASLLPAISSSYLSQHGRDIATLSQDRPLLLVFLR